jgi:hypothetical protein
MKIEEILPPALIKKFEDFSKQVDSMATLQLSRYHKIIVNEINKHPEISLFERKQQYNSRMKYMKDVVKEKREKALNIYFIDLLDGNN